MIFEWDSEKARTNSLKHQVSFEEAQTIFADAFSITYEDAEHSLIEERLLEIGFSQQNRLLAVIYVERSETVRLISTFGDCPGEKRL